MSLSRRGWSNKSVVSKSIGVMTKDHREYSMIVAPIQHTETFNSKQSNRSPKARLIAIAYTSLHNTIEVHPNDHLSLTVHTFINYTDVFKHESEMQAAIPELKVSLRETVKKLIDFSFIFFPKKNQIVLQNKGFHIGSQFIFHILYDM